MTGQGLLVGCGETSIRDALAAVERTQFPGMQVERILLPGGCWWLAQAAAASGSRLKRLVVGRVPAVEAVASLLSHPGLASVALTAHQDCAWYREHFPSETAGQLVKRSGQDLFTARGELQRIASQPLPITGTVLLRTDGEWTTRRLFQD